MLAQVALVLLAFADPATVQVETLPFDVAALRSMPSVELRVTERGTPVVYKGVALRALLADRLKGPDEMASLRALSDSVVLVRATDDYQAAFSAAEVAMDRTGRRVLLALERDGKPLDKQGPVKLIVPGDSEHVRWVRMVSAVELVHMPKPKAR